MLQYESVWLLVCGGVLVCMYKYVSERASTRARLYMHESVSTRGFVSGERGSLSLARQDTGAENILVPALPQLCPS